jgi:hypothetical protein
VNVREYEQMIMAVSGKDIAEFTRRLLSSKPSLAVFGENADKVSYENLLQRYKQVDWSRRATNNLWGVPIVQQQQAQEQRPVEVSHSVHGVFERLKAGFTRGGSGLSSSSSSSSREDGPSGVESSSSSSSSSSSGDSSSRSSGTSS